MGRRTPRQGAAAYRRTLTVIGSRLLEIGTNVKTDQLGTEVDLVVYGEFDDEAALAAFKAHPLYQASIDRVVPLPRIVELPIRVRLASHAEREREGGTCVRDLRQGVVVLDRGLRGRGGHAEEAERQRREEHEQRAAAGHPSVLPGSDYPCATQTVRTG